MSRFLVTGGAGFIGSHLAEELLRRGHKVRVLDNLSTGLIANVPVGAEFIRGDVIDPSVVAGAIAGCEFVLHQAAISSVQQSIDDPRPSHEANVNGTLNVLIAARDYGVRRVVYAASAAAYGNAPALPKVEDMPPDPQSPYALQKYVGEEYCALFTRLYGLETVALRYFNVFGPRQHASSPYSGVLSLFIRAALSGVAPTIYGDGEQTRDFTFVDNVVDSVLLAVDAPRAPGEVINVANGDRVSLNRAWAALEQILGSLPSPIYELPRVGDIRHSQADVCRAVELLGYRPRIAFLEGLGRTIDWAREVANDN